MPNLELRKKENLSSFRRIAIGTWKTAYDPSVYGSINLPMEKMLEYQQAFREITGRKITMTHIMAKVMAEILKKMPDANAILRWNRIYLRQRIGVFFQVAMQDPKTGEMDLSGGTVQDADQKTLLTIFDEFSASVEKIRSGKDKKLEGTRNTFKSIPFFLLNTFLNTIGLLSYTFNLDLRFMGIPKDPFGSVMVTNIGSLGLDDGYVPLVRYSRVPLLVALGKIKDEVVAVNGEAKVEKRMGIYVTFDHRILDGSHAAKMTHTLRACFEQPEKFLGSLEDLKIELAKVDLQKSIEPASS